MRLLRGKLATMAHRLGAVFLLVTLPLLSWQTQQKPTPPRAPHDEGLPSQQREHPRAHPENKQPGSIDPGCLCYLLVQL